MKIPRKHPKQVKINTTALPDIIFMLLFFFMVTTVLQDEDKQELNLPNALNHETLEREESRDLNIILGQIDDQKYVKVNDVQVKFNSAESLIQAQIERQKSSGIFPDKAKLWIDAKSQMSEVNTIKSALQNSGVLKVEFVHSFKH